MVRKTKESENPEQNALVDAVCSSAQQIWEAGLGAFARAQKEGSELFDRLVQEGGDLARLTEHLAPERGLLGGGSTMSRLASGVSKQASDSWDKLERLFEDRVARAIRSLGVPSQDDVANVRRQLDEMRARLDAMDAHGAKPARKPAARTAAKPAAKQTAKLAAKGAAIKGGARASAKRAARPASH